jgi:hypothetical protein
MITQQIEVRPSALLIAFLELRDRGDGPADEPRLLLAVAKRGEQGEFGPESLQRLPGYLSLRFQASGSRAPWMTPNTTTSTSCTSNTIE